MPALAPPPKSPMNATYADSSPRFNPFDKTGLAQAQPELTFEGQQQMTRTDSQV